MVIVDTIRVLKKATIAVYKGLMKYSGTTMILDGVEARRRWRRNRNRSAERSNTQSIGDQLSKKEK
ncbi:MAG: hypothetical protein FJ012_11410 [Chloroflexi bacterium]|nr:hypothetical protein [Chloroflexota bacterium]